MVEVLYFAAVREIVGVNEEQLELPEEVQTVRQFVAHLQQVRPELRGKLASVRVALDEAFAEECAPLQGARTIALIPPVAGG